MNHTGIKSEPFMTEKQKAEELINSYRIILMNEDTDCGCEILCTSIAIKSSIVAVNEILKSYLIDYELRKNKTYWHPYDYWLNVKKEIEKY